MSNENSKLDAERAAFEAAYAEGPFGRTPCGARYISAPVEQAFQGWMLRTLKESLSVASLPVGVPDGYALVPVEPTAEMLEAAWNYHGSPAYTSEVRPDNLTDAECYRAMLAAAPAAPTVKESLSVAARDVLAERQRQITAEGWSPEHDDEHDGGELSDAASCYARLAHNDPGFCIRPAYWPWDKSWWKPSTPRHNLIKAGALILAEIERIDRAEQAKQQEVSHD